MKKYVLMITEENVIMGSEKGSIDIIVFCFPPTHSREGIKRIREKRKSLHRLKELHNLWRSRGHFFPPWRNNIFASMGATSKVTQWRVPMKLLFLYPNLLNLNSNFFHEPLQFNKKECSLEYSFFYWTYAEGAVGFEGTATTVASRAWGKSYQWFIRRRILPPLPSCNHWV